MLLEVVLNPVKGVVARRDGHVTQGEPAIVDRPVRDADHDERQAGEGLCGPLLGARHPLVQGDLDRAAAFGCDVALQLGEQFDLVLGVTVLQHMLDPAAVCAALQRMAAHLAPGGRMVLLEAAPSRVAPDCDSTVFRARQRSAYLALFHVCGLRVQAITGVDPAPFRTRLLPHLPRLPRPVSMAALALATALSTPVDALFGRLAVERSWHAVFVLERSGTQAALCA